MNFLAGDIGGTKTRLAIVEVGNVPARGRPIGSPLLRSDPFALSGVAASHTLGETIGHSTRLQEAAAKSPVIPQTAGFSKVRILREKEYPSRNFATFEALLAEFLNETQTPSHAAFGIAGPVLNGAVFATNLPWFIKADVLKQRFSFKECDLLNDLEATAYGLSALGVEDLMVLQQGDPDACGNAAIIAAGTGLGEAGLYWDGQQHHPYATEGGHTSFSPQNELEFALFCHLQLRHIHVSWERVVSGMGLRDLHDFMRIYRKSVVPKWLENEMQAGDAVAAISRAALAESDDICIETLDIFVRLYGAEAGNFSLKTMSRGGFYVGGGIAPKILPLLQRDIFMQAFLSKGRMRPLLEAMPVRVILNDRAALYGPALRAAQSA